MLVFAFFIAACAVSSSKAKGIDVDSILKKSEAALDAMHAGSRKMMTTLKSSQGVTQEWTARKI